MTAVSPLNVSTSIAEFAANCSYHELPQSSRAFARSLLIDSIACALVAERSDETPIYSRFAKAIAGGGNSTVIGSPERLSVLGAVLLNGYKITAATLNDVYIPGHVHITPEVVPAALAIAEQHNANGQTLLSAIAIGSEIAVRVSDALDYGVSVVERGWHFPGVIGQFGAAVAVGRILELSASEMLLALSLAVSQASGTQASWGTPAVKFHQSRGAVSGLLAGLLARERLSASLDGVTATKGGFLTTYSDGGNPEAAISEMGQRFGFEQISLRLWPGGTPVQPTVTSLLDLLEKTDVPSGSVSRVRIFLAPALIATHGSLIEPTGTFDALISHRFVVASALREGRFWYDMVTPEAIHDPGMREFLRDRMQLVPDPDLTRDRSYVELMLENGTLLVSDVTTARGSPSNPATIDDLYEKFSRCADGRLGERDADDLWAMLLDIENMWDLAPLFAILRRADGKV